MGALSCLWCKNTAEASAKDGAEGLSSLLPQVQAGAHHQRTEFSNRDHGSARRKGAVLTAIPAVMHCIFFRRKNMKKFLIQKLGLLGVVSFLSYTAAVVFAPLAYPGYNWLAQAVSDLSAVNAPRWHYGISSAPFTMRARSFARPSSVSASKDRKPSCSVRAFICSPAWSGSRRSRIGCSR